MSDAAGMPKFGVSRRMVVKIGSALLLNAACGSASDGWMHGLMEDLITFRSYGTEVLLVTSGTIVTGQVRRRALLKHECLAARQAAAAIGQLQLAHLYFENFARHGLVAAQVLLTPGELTTTGCRENMRALIEQLLLDGNVPILNENNTVTTFQNGFPDNDYVAALVAQLLDADLLVLLTDVNGLYTSDPRLDPTARHISHVVDLNDDIFAMARAASTKYGSGGMVTKLAAVDIAMRSGCRAVITNGDRLNPLQTMNEEGTATWFLPKQPLVRFASMSEAASVEIASAAEIAGQIA